MDKKNSNIHSGHRHRMRERYAEYGADGFRDHELLELLLSFSIARKDTNPLGHALIDQFGDLRGVLNAAPEELMKVPGIGENSVTLLKMIPGLTRRYYEELGNTNDRLDDPKRRLSFFVPRFIGCERECLYAAFLDDNHKLIKCELQYEGSINAVEIHSERIVNNALRLGAHKVIIAHNHFNYAIPSLEDCNATAFLSDNLWVHGILLLDHIIVCGTNAASMKEVGKYNPPIHEETEKREN